MSEIGVLGSGERFCYDLVATLCRKGVSAEICKIGETRMLERSPYKVIIDRWSFLVEYLRSYLKTVALSGTYVINNPFMDSADDKFFEYSLATKMGIKVPRTVCLPSFSLPEGLDGEVNNISPVNWEKVIDYVGLPAVMKPYDGWAWQDVHKVTNLNDIMEVYRASGKRVYVFQEYIKYEHYVRAFVIGGEHTLPIKYNPESRCYIWDPQHLTSELGREIVDACRRLNSALNYDFNTVEFAIRRGEPYAIDFWNTVPEMDPRAIPEEYYNWVLNTLADTAIKYCREEKKMPFWGTPGIIG
ncbi:MAG: ATP-grasp domain-containing protein [bacterium]